MDRNIYVSLELPFVRWSLSARRAWIEMGNYCERSGMLKVALRKESVDRNNFDFILFAIISSRSPQGERG